MNKLLKLNNMKCYSHLENSQSDWVITEKISDDENDVIEKKKRTPRRSSKNVATRVASPDLMPLPDSPEPGTSGNVPKLNETFSPKPNDRERDMTYRDSENLAVETRRSNRKSKLIKYDTEFPANDSMLKKPLFRKGKITPKNRMKAPIASPELIDTPVQNKLKLPSIELQASPLPMKTPGSTLKRSIRKAQLMPMHDINSTIEKKNVTFHSPANMEMSILEIDEIMQSDKKRKFYNLFSYTTYFLLFTIPYVYIAIISSSHLIKYIAYLKFNILFSFNLRNSIA